jgi:hypothetical protein
MLDDLIALILIVDNTTGMIQCGFKTYKILVGKPEGKRPRGRPACS